MSVGEQPMNDSYYAWLIRQRVYCARDLCYARAVTVRNFQGEDICLCQTHADRLDAVRESEKKQETHK